ncbi:MAG: hypothetical protein ACFE96_15555 [Candidatus Hermodarchaeota archaeon]
MSNNNEDYELDYYLSIIDFFQNQTSDRETTELWRNKSFIHLMKVLKRTRRKEFVKNAIILILSLFDKLPPDSYNSKGVPPTSLTSEDRLSFVNILKSEFINDIPN